MSVKKYLDDKERKKLQMNDEEQIDLLGAEEEFKQMVKKLALSIDDMIADLGKYLRIARDTKASGLLKDDNLDSYEMLQAPYTHRSNIKSRLTLIRQLLILSGGSL